MCLFHSICVNIRGQLVKTQFPLSSMWVQNIEPKSLGGWQVLSYPIDPALSFSKINLYEAGIGVNYNQLCTYSFFSL